RRRPARVDDDGAAVPGCVAPKRPRVRVRHIPRGRSGRHAVPARVPRLPPTRRHHQSQGPLTMWAAIVLLLLGGPEPSSPPWQGRETVAAIQVHGNTITRDDEVRRLAGIEIGAVVEANTLDEVAARLRTAKRFDDVRVLKRFASIEDPSQILLVIIVDEGPVHIERTGDEVTPTRVVRSHPLGLMVMPVLSREDGFGFTYGARLARRTVAGRNRRLSFPLTWGGEKKAGADFEKTMEHAPVDRVIAGAAVSQRTNPFYERDDNRQRAWVRVERELVPALRVGATAGWRLVSFMDLHDRFPRGGADVVLDPRVDPNLPRNAVFARASWERLGGPARA